MPRLLAPLAAIVCLVALGAAPVRAQIPSAAPALSTLGSWLYLDWLSGWNPVARDVGDALRIAIDPETGTWGMAPVDQALRTSGIVPAPLVIHHPNGMTEAILDPSVVDWLVVRIGADGRPVVDCVGSESRNAVLQAPAAAGPPDR